MKKILLIINPVAGKKEVVFRLKEVLNVFTSNGVKLDLRFIVNKNDAEDYIKNFANINDVVVCAGGDGTLNSIINLMMKYNIKTPLGYIPCGSTNDFGNTVGIPSDVVKAAKVIVKGTPKAIDIGKFNNRYFVYVAAFGAFTKSSYSTPQDLKNIFGHFAYVLNGMTEIPNIREESIAITTETGEQVKGKYLLGAIANTRSIGGLIKLDKKDVNLADGYFELILIGIPKDIKDLNDITNFIEKKKAKGPMFTFMHAKKLIIKSKKSSMWTIDGEGIKINKNETFINVHNAIKIILPNK